MNMNYIICCMSGCTILQYCIIYYDHQLLYNSYSTCNNQGVKCLKEPGTSGKTIQMEWKAITKTWQLLKLNLG